MILFFMLGPMRKKIIFYFLLKTYFYTVIQIMVSSPPTPPRPSPPLHTHKSTHLLALSHIRKQTGVGKRMKDNKQKQMNRKK